MVSSISGNSDYLAYLLEQLTTTSTSLLTSSTSSLDSDSTSSVMSGSEMFAKLTDEMGGDGKTISKDDLASYIKTVESDTTGSYDKGSLGFLNQLYTNWDSISGGDDTITASEMEAGSSYLQPPTSAPSSDSSGSLASDLYSALTEAADTNGDGTVSMSELLAYLGTIESSDSTDSTSTTDNASSDTTKSTTTSETSSTNNSKELSFIKDLIENFEDYADDSGNITSSSFFSALSLPQDPSTVTSEQLISPIDLKV